MSTLKKFDLFNEHLQQEEEQKQNSTEYDFLWKIEENPPESEEEEEKNAEPPSLFKLTPSDCLIDLS